MHVEKSQQAYNIRVSVPVLHTAHCKSYSR